MARKLRLGIIGTGVAARELYLPAFEELRDRIELVACANRTRSRAEDYARLAGVATVHDTARDVIDDPDVDAVFLSLPIDQLAEHVLMALEAGMPVVSEKPIAESAEAGRRLLDAASAHDVPYVVAENFAFMSHAHQLAEWVGSGRLGELRHVAVRHVAAIDESVPYFHTGWRQQPAHVGGFVVDGGVHVANVVHRCFGPVAEVRGFADQLDDALPPVDTVVAALRFESGLLGTWTTCMSSPGSGPVVEVWGTDGVGRFWERRAELTTTDGEVVESPARENSFTAQFRHVADVVLDGAEPIVTPAETLEDLVLMERLVSGG